MTEQFEVVLIINRTRCWGTNIYWYEWLNKFLEQSPLRIRATEHVYASTNTYWHDWMNKLTQIVTLLIRVT